MNPVDRKCQYNPNPEEIRQYITFMRDIYLCHDRKTIRIEK